MTKQDALKTIDDIKDQLQRADEKQIYGHKTAQAIGSLIIAIDHLSEIVRELVEAK